MLTKKIKEFLLENFEELETVVREINAWNGNLDHLDYQENDEEFFNTFFEGRVNEAVRAVCYGYYSYTDDLVKFNGYGNLESISYYQYEKELKEEIGYIVEELIDQKENLQLSDELEEIFENYNEEE